MAVAAVSTIPSASPLSGQYAAVRGLFGASKTLRDIARLKVVEEMPRVEDGKISEFPVAMQMVFVLEENEP